MISHNRTKIICTIGPASEDKATLRRMILAGMDVARLNFSHGSYKNFETIIKNIRSVSKELGTPVAIMQDLQGPKIRVGEMPEGGVTLIKGQEIKLTPKRKKGSKNIIPILYKKLVQDVKPRDRILLKDGIIELSVIKVEKGEIYARVNNDGTITSHAGINVPTASIKANVITKKDIKDLTFGIKHNVDFVAISFVKKAQNIRELRALIKKKKGHAKIVAKIERHEAIRNLENIIEEADVIMVARGDLGVELSPQQVPLLQKKMIHQANLHGKPVITATEMLASMVKNPRATRAEVSDAANAIFDHSDALMLSNETAVGKYPVKSTRTLNQVATSIEKELQKNEQLLPNRLKEGPLPSSQAVCLSAAQLAVNIKAKAIVSLTHSGFTAYHIAKHRVYIPHIVITNNHKVQRQLKLVWGINDVFVQKIDSKNYQEHVKKLLKKHRIGKKHDKVVIVSNASRQEKVISVLVL